MSEHVVCTLDELPPGEARRVDVDGHRIALDPLRRRRRTPSATAAPMQTSRCPRARSISTSARSSAGSTAARFSLVTGEPQSLPATRPVPVYDVTRRRATTSS